MKLELIAITITLSSQPDLGLFSHHWDLSTYCLGTLQSSITTLMQGKKMKHKKLLELLPKFWGVWQIKKLKPAPVIMSWMPHDELPLLCRWDLYQSLMQTSPSKTKIENAQDAFHAALPHCEKPGKEMLSLSCCFPGKIWSPPLPKGLKGSKFISKFFLSSSKQLWHTGQLIHCLTDRCFWIPNNFLWPSSVVGPRLTQELSSTPTGVGANLCSYVF